MTFSFFVSVLVNLISGYLHFPSGIPEFDFVRGQLSYCLNMTLSCGSKFIRDRVLEMHLIGLR